MVAIVNFYGSLFFSYYFSVADAAIDAAAITNCPKQEKCTFLIWKEGICMPENRGCGCGGFGFGGDCCWIIILIIILFCCCGCGNNECGC